jgi:hypothetical protein
VRRRHACLTALSAKVRRHDSAVNEMISDVVRRLLDVFGTDSLPLPCPITGASRRPCIYSDPI